MDFASALSRNLNYRIATRVGVVCAMTHIAQWNQPLGAPSRTHSSGECNIKQAGPSPLQGVGNEQAGKVLGG